jgi:hypothetical protein
MEMESRPATTSRVVMEGPSVKISLMVESLLYQSSEAATP